MNQDDLTRELAEHHRQLRRINRITLALVLFALACVAYNAHRTPEPAVVQPERPASAPARKPASGLLIVQAPKESPP